MTYPYDTPRIGHVNTQRIDTCSIGYVMTDSKADRLRSARQAARYASASEAAAAFGWNESGYRHHENGTRGFGADAAAKYGKAFRVRPSWLLGLDDTPRAHPEVYTDESKLYVHGEVEAGVWREPTEGQGLFTLDLPPPIPGKRRFGVIVSGYSMDECYAPGTVLDCVTIHSLDLEPDSGDHVVVERIKPDGLREMTVKELVQRDGQFWLRARSTKPEFKEDILIGSPCNGHVGEDEVRVIGYVVSSINRHGLKTLMRLGKFEKVGWFPFESEFSDT